MGTQKLSSLFIILSNDNKIITLGKTQEQSLCSDELLTSWKKNNSNTSTLVCCTYNFCHTLEKLLTDIFSDYRISDGVFKSECYMDMVDIIDEIDHHNKKIISIHECLKIRTAC